MINPSSTPLFSIITITWNNVNGFIKTHKSLNAQSFQNYEWIIVDGASNDGTLDYIHEHGLSTQCASEKDNGIYHAMNKGISRANGQYLLFLNAGDELADADILSTLSKAITAHAPDFIYGDALEETSAPRPFFKKARTHKRVLWGMFTHHQAMIYRRNIMGDLRYNEQYKIASDYELTVRFLSKAKNIHYIPGAICLFERGGISQRQMTLGRVEQFKIRRSLKLCSLPMAMAIYVGQTFRAFLKMKIAG